MQLFLTEEAALRFRCRDYTYCENALKRKPRLDFNRS